MSETVGGYLCRTCADVALAKRGIDPARPKQDELVRRAAEKQALGVNQPGPPEAAIGGRLNLFA